MDGVSLEESLSEMDRNLFRQFRERTSDLQWDQLKNDQYVARWLKARSWDVDKAEKMFRSHLQWRKEMKMDEVMKSYKMPDVIEKYFPGGICGQDKFGRPAFICPAGATDVYGLMHSASRAQLLLSQCYVMQRITDVVLPAQARKMGRPIDQLVVIFDLQHMNRRQLWRPWLNFVLEITSIFEVNFPELMAVCFVLNAPSFFSMVFSLLKPLLSKETQDKIHILGSNYADDLLKLFDPEGLPAHYGGTMCDPDGDPKCSSKICWAGTVPEFYYQIQQTPNSPTEESDDTFLLVAVNRGSKEYYHIGEAKVGDKISWEFYTESNDIAFSLWVEPQGGNHSPVDEQHRRRSVKSRGQSGGGGAGGAGGGGGGISTSFSFNNLIGGQGTGKLDLKQVTQPTRVDCDLVPEIGTLKANVEGSYYLLFDNSYSWTRTKRVWCKADVTPSPTSAQNANASNGLLEEADEKEVEAGLSEVMETVCAPDYVSLSTPDVNISALAMVLLKTLPIIRRRSRPQSNLPPQAAMMK